MTSTTAFPRPKALLANLVLLSPAGFPLGTPNSPCLPLPAVRAMLCPHRAASPPPCGDRCEPQDSVAWQLAGGRGRGAGALARGLTAERGQRGRAQSWERKLLHVSRVQTSLSKKRAVSQRMCDSRASAGQAAGSRSSAAANSNASVASAACTAAPAGDASSPSATCCLMRSAVAASPRAACSVARAWCHCSLRLQARLDGRDSSLVRHCCKRCHLASVAQVGQQQEEQRVDAWQACHALQHTHLRCARRDGWKELMAGQAARSAGSGLKQGCTAEASTASAP